MVFLGIMGLVVILDQLSKFWIVHALALYESREIIPGLFNLTHVTNTGAAFSLLAGRPALWRQVFFITITVLALVAIGFMQRRLAVVSRWYTLSLGLIGGGAAGNLIDRFRLGAVVDFLDFYVGRYHWPAFNVADSAITVGVGLFLVLQFTRPASVTGS